MTKPMRIDQDTDALIAVDVQPAFMPGGGLGVAGGDEIIPVVRKLMGMFDRRFATLDRHPLGHISFASSYRFALDVGNGPKPMEMLCEADLTEVMPAPHAKFSRADMTRYYKEVCVQFLWPDHAIENTTESKLHPAFSPHEFEFVQVKGTDPACDSYSGFCDNLERPTGFADVVADSGAKRLFICGLAFDFCVGWTALDAVKVLPDAEVFVVEDACRSVNLPGSVAKMTQELGYAGLSIVHSTQLTRS